MTEQGTEPIITIENLTCRYGKKVALDRVSFDVTPGRVFGLVGENGAGKTTLMKHLLGALTPQDGAVRVFGADPTRNPTAVLSQIGYLSEDRDLPRWMRVKELMRYTQAFFPDWDESYAEQLRQQFRLDAGTKIRSLSRGEKAKAGLLAALAHRPKLLLLDEPSSGLDAVARKEILAVVMRAVAEEGRTVVFSSHLLDEVERVVDDVAMIHEGRLALLMSMDELKATHQRRVIEFTSDMKTFPKVEGVLHVEGEGREWAVVTHGDADITRKALERAGARILEESVPTLDAIFVARVTGDRSLQAVA
ncbi:MAG: ABC transporter ATP-binding protein [Candidatus Hydrogenedentales bacterium]|jgi:ABC-2 type transport system ATP-binding protein